MDSNLRPQDVDIIFTKAKPQGQRKLDNNAFQVCHCFDGYFSKFYHSTRLNSCQVNEESLSKI